MTAELVFISPDGEPSTTSLVIATETDNEHASVIKLIRENADDLNEIGTLRFEIAKSGGRPTEYAVMDEPASALLMTYLRNNPVVKDFKKRLVAGFYTMRQMLTERSAPALPQTREERLARALIDASEMLAEKDEQIAAVTTEKKCLEAAIERDAPLVAKAEAHTSSDSSIHRQEFAREVIAWGMKQHNIVIRQEHVMRYLGHIGLFVRGERTDTGHATSDALKRGLAFTDKGIAKNGHAWATGKLTARGQDYAWKRITKHVADNGTLELPRALRGGESA